MDHYFTNNNLKSDVRTINYSYNSFSFTFLSDLGVFSKNKIDYGSKILLEAYLNQEPRSLKVLDMGCGYGFIGISISKITGSDVTLADINKRALHLTERNIKENKVNAKVVESNTYSNINEKYDCIITNPPIRAGKKVILDMLINSVNYLNKNGRIYFVIRKDQGALSIRKELEKTMNVDVINKDKGFLIFSAKSN